MTRTNLLALVIMLSACAVEVPDETESAELARAGFTYRTIDYPGATATLVLGLNDFGQYVGLFVDARGPHAMLFDGHALAPLDPDGVLGASPRSRAYAINNLGHVVGSYSDPSGALHGFVRRGSTVTTIDAPDGAPTEVYGINDLGELIGVTYDDVGAAHGFSLHGTVFEARDLPGTLSTVPLSINDFGEVVGEAITIEGTIGHGYRQTARGAVTLYDAPAAPADSTYFFSINNRHAILGTSFDDQFRASHFILHGLEATPFALPEAFGPDVVAQTLNDFGDVAGYYADEAGARHGFLARRAR
jgi:uncharacterized membrane protein